MPVIFSMIEFRWFRAGRRISARQNGSWNAAAWSSASRHPAFRNCGSLGGVLGGSWPLASLPLPEVVERKEALVGVEPTVADLQTRSVSYVAFSTGKSDSPRAWPSFAKSAATV